MPDLALAAGFIGHGVAGHSEICGREQTNVSDFSLLWRVVVQAQLLSHAQVAVYIGAVVPTVDPLSFFSLLYYISL